MAIATSTLSSDTGHVGELLRQWRARRRMSQLALSMEADISTRHLSFIETGRARPSRDMLLLLSGKLDVPLRVRNVMLVTAGFAPVYPERALESPALSSVREAVELVVRGHDPWPALAVDRHWTLVMANDALVPLIGDVDPALMQAPVNVLRLSLHPAGLASRILNFNEWRDHLLHRLHRQLEATGDVEIADLIDELAAYPVPESAGPGAATRTYAGVVVPLKLATDHGVATLFSTTTVFGTPVDVTLSELAIEAFFPADADTKAILGRWSDERVQAR